MAACLWCAGLQVELAQTCQARPEFEPRASLVGRGAPFYLIGQRTTTTWQLCEAAMQLINVLLAGVSVCFKLSGGCLPPVLSFGCRPSVRVWSGDGPRVCRDR